VLGGEPSVVLADRKAGRYVRFGEDAALLLDRMDGTRTVAELAREAGAAAGVTLPEPPVRRFVEDLARRGFLDGTAGEPPTRRHSVLFYRVPLVDPDRTAAALAPLGRIAFSGPGIATAIALAAIGGTLLAAAGSAVPVPPLDRWPALVAFYVAGSLALTAHELGHAVALKARGGEVHEAGLLLLYGMPCLYVNVSDAWLLPSLRDRLVVSSAGLLVELALFGAAAAALALLPLGGLPTVALFAVFSVCGLRSVLVNLNPLIRLDGYYLLSDLAGVPNLRARALRSIGGVLGRGAPRAPDRKRRGERLLPVYGALSIAYVGALIGGVLWLSAGWAARAAGGVGLAGWLIPAGVLLWSVLAGFARGLRGDGDGRVP
jgi:putative peptide zinc metalloprotease protein